jgi:hypothetical protein
MGFYPKHLHRRREQRALRVIATAALAGAQFVRVTIPRSDGRDWGVSRWYIRYYDGQASATQPTKLRCAQIYLRWWHEYGIKSTNIGALP